MMMKAVIQTKGKFIRLSCSPMPCSHDTANLKFDKLVFAQPIRDEDTDFDSGKPLNQSKQDFKTRKRKTFVCFSCFCFAALAP
jgi:hypothetical protein